MLERRTDRYFVITQNASQTNYVKLVAARPILSATKIYSEESSFQQYMIYNQ